MRTPVFIVGAPRSGTTLLRVVLNRHPELAICGETNYFHRIYARRHVFGDFANPRNRARAAEAYLATPTARHLEMDLTVLRDRLARDGKTCRDFFAAMLETFAALQGKPHTGEKTPWHSLYVKTLLEWFPSSSIIHLVRDPRDAVSSLITMPWESRSVLAASRVWRRFNAAAGGASDRSNYLLVKYEEFVSAPEQQLRAICDHTGLGYSPEMMGPRSDENSERWWSRRAHEDISPARIGSWRKNLEGWRISAIEAIASPLMEDFGYRREAPRASVFDMGRAGAEGVFEIACQKIFRAPSILSRVLRPANLASEEEWRARASELYGRLRSRTQATHQA